MTAPAARIAGLLALTANVLAALVLAGCATPAAKPVVAPPWDERRAELQALPGFELTGRVAVAAAGEGFSAKLRWEQAGERGEVALDGPLGVGGVRIETDGRALEMTDSHGQHLGRDAAREELRRRLGFEPPLASLRYWVLGVPDPADPAAEVVGDDRRLQALEQAGWRVDYTAYVPHGDGWRPQRLTLQRDGVRVRLVVDGWGR